MYRLFWVLLWVLAGPAWGQEGELLKAGQVAPVQTKLRVGTKSFKPFVFEQNGVWVGFSIDLWEAIANEQGWSYELEGIETVPELLSAVQQGRVDFAVAGLTITSAREQTVDFSYAFFQSGLHILVRENSEASAFDVVRALLSPELWKLVGLLFVVLLVAAHVIWLLERGSEDFPRGYAAGVWEAFWWASVTITTVGYGDRVPRQRSGRIVALVWMFLGVVLIAYFTASVTTVLTVNQLQGRIAGPKDLPGNVVGTVDGTTAERWLDDNGLKVRGFAHLDEAIAALLASEIDAVVYDAPVLLHYTAHEGRGQARVAGPMFARQAYGIAMPENSPYREALDRSLLTLQEDGTYADLYEKWFGSE